MFPCDDFYQGIITFRSMVVALWGEVSALWRQCSAQTCRWWCLCCNKWVCWLVTVLLAVLLAVLVVVYAVFSVIVATTCWGTCFLLFMIVLMTNRGDVSFSCLWAPAGPPADPTRDGPPTIKITEPADGATFPDGDKVAITFTATASDPDGTALTGSAVQWEEFLDTSPATYQQLGEGTQIAVTLPQRPVDVASNRLSAYAINANVTGTNGRTASDSVNISVGRIRLT